MSIRLLSGCTIYDFCVRVESCCGSISSIFFFFQAEDGIRDLVRSRGLGDVYKRQGCGGPSRRSRCRAEGRGSRQSRDPVRTVGPRPSGCLLYTSDAADERSSVDLGGRRIIKKKKHQ